MPLSVMTESFDGCTYRKVEWGKGKAYFLKMFGLQTTRMGGEKLRYIIVNRTDKCTKNRLLFCCCFFCFCFVFDLGFLFIG